MKSLLLPLSILMLFASCQPSGNGTSSAETTTTQPTQSGPALTNEGSEPIVVNARKEATETKAVKNSTSKSKAFQVFLKGFPEASLPLALNEKTSKSINDKQYISYDYERFVPEMAGVLFSREVGKEFYYLARVSEAEQYTAVVYAVKNVMMGDNAPYGYVLASYNSKGKLIDKLVAGGQIELEDALRTGSIQPDLTMEIKEYRQKWEKDPKEEGYYDNKVVGTTLKKTHHYHIAADGHIVKDQPLLSMK